MANAAQDPIVGIDLGTTHSLVATCDASGPRVLADDAGRSLLPSVVRFVRGGAPVVGHAARAEAVLHAVDTVHSSKRFMGRGHAESAALAEGLSYPVVAGPRGLAAFDVGGAVVTPQEVAAHVLRELKSIAEARLGTEVRRAVVTVPAYFDDAQRQATRDAVRLAGLEAVRIVNEPTAAALAYGIGASRSRRTAMETIAVYDFGGGTFDVSVLQLVPGGPDDGEFFQVLSTAGDTRLGGDDLDEAIVAMLAGELRERFGAALEFPPAARQAMRTFAERAKIALSSQEEATLEIDLGAIVANWRSLAARLASGAACAAVAVAGAVFVVGDPEGVEGTLGEMEAELHILPGLGTQVSSVHPFNLELGVVSRGGLRTAQDLALSIQHLPALLSGQAAQGIAHFAQDDQHDDEDTDQSQQDVQR